MDAALAAFHHFCRGKAADIRSIATRTGGEAEPCDVEQHAWIMAAMIRERHGHSIDFSNEADQKRILRWLNCEFGRFADKTVRHATRLETDPGDDDPLPLSERLSAQHLDPLHQTPLLERDPLTQLLDREDAHEDLETAQQSFSEAAAYELLLIQFNRNMKDLARHLNISRRRLAGRIERLRAYADIQPSLFDGTEKISFDFEPHRLLSRTRRKVEQCTFEQLHFAFDAPVGMHLPGTTLKQV